MTIIEGIGDEVILFLAISFIAAVIICIFILPLQYRSHSTTLPSQQETLLQQSSNSFSEQHNTLENDSTQIAEAASENARDSNDRYTQLTDTNPVNDQSTDSTDSLQELPGEDPNKQDKKLLVDDPEYLRKRRLEFFGEQSTSSSNERVNNWLANSVDRNDKSATVLSSRHSEASVSNDNTTECNSTPIPSDGSVRIRLKYLNDAERLVYSKLDHKIGDFKRTHFLEEIANNKIIRLIYNGQLLSGEERTLESFGVVSNAVIHVQISQNQQQQRPTTTDDSDLDLSHLMWPLFGIILGVLWMLHFQYREYFNITSTIALIGITGLFLTAVWSQSSFHRGMGGNPQPSN